MAMSDLRSRIRELLTEQYGNRHGSQAALARAAGITRATVSGWHSGSTNSIDYESAIAIERALGWRHQWLMRGETPKRTSADQGTPHAQVLGNASQPEPVDAPRIVAWEALMHTMPIKERFRLEVQDAALSPRLMPGDYALLESGIDPRPGDGVLVRDRSGRHYLRTYRQTEPDRWAAVATNQAFGDLDAERFGLAVVAVIVGSWREERWG